VNVKLGEIEVQRTDGLAVVSISGEHDLNTAPDLGSKLARLIDAREGIVVDMSPASFVDSSVLGVILDSRRQARSSGQAFEVVHDGETDAVGRVLEITGLVTELPVHPTTDAARAAASATAAAADD
jgi:anti-sigma B factor antagonist